jgi:atypical dual specificity phosphatase
MSEIFKKLKHQLGLTQGSDTWIDPSVVACAYPGTETELAALAAQQVSVIINLHTKSHDQALLARYNLREIHLPTRDFTAPKPVDLKKGVTTIEEALKEGRRVAVHCGAGLGRTGTLLACYFVHRGMKPDQAIQHVRRLRPGSVETSSQIAAVSVFASSMK